MNKSQLIEKVALGANISKVLARKTINTIISSVTESLKNGDNVSLLGFGTFTIRKREARIGRNPKNGEEIIIAATKVPIFKAGKIFKNVINL